MSATNLQGRIALWTVLAVAATACEPVGSRPDAVAPPPTFSASLSLSQQAGSCWVRSADDWTYSAKTSDGTVGMVMKLPGMPDPVVTITEADGNIQQGVVVDRQQAIAWYDAREHSAGDQVVSRSHAELKAEWTSARGVELRGLVRIARHSCGV